MSAATIEVPIVAADPVAAEPCHLQMVAVRTTRRLLFWQHKSAVAIFRCRDTATYELLAVCRSCGYEARTVLCGPHTHRATARATICGICNDEAVIVLAVNPLRGNG